METDKQIDNVNDQLIIIKTEKKIIKRSKLLNTEGALC